MSEPFTLAELVDIFWQSDAAEVLAHQWSIARVYVARNLSLVSITSADPIAPDKIDFKSEVVEFYLEGQQFGKALWVAVMCQQMVIVRPFPLADRSLIPTMYKQEKALASRPGSTRLEF